MCIVKKGMNGKNYVTKESVESIFHCTDGNSKTGYCGNWNVAIEYTCDHRCECYKKGLCYAEQGCYNFTSNQQQYTENFNYFNSVPSETFCDMISSYITANHFQLFRYFTCGDIVNERFFQCMIDIAKKNHGTRFWSYTKKYHIVNSWCDKYGVENIPENLVIIFSHWLNEDGTYFPMDNPYNFPTSEFIPYGREDLLETVTHVCPCSDPTVKATCETCDRPCYKLKHGESMALCEHSTKKTKERDKALKAAKAAL